MGKLLLLFVVVPLLEAVLLAKIGAAIGWANTIALVILTGVVGAWLFKLEGGRAWRKWQRALATGKTPEDGVLGGLLLLLGGAFLITPGVVTDAVGLLLLLPPTRHLLVRFLRPRIMSRFFEGAGSAGAGSDGGGFRGGFRVMHFGLGGEAGRHPFDVEVVDDDDAPPRSAGEGAGEGADEGAGESEAVVVGRRVTVRRPSTPPADRPRVIDADFEVVDRDSR